MENTFSSDVVDQSQVIEVVTSGDDQPTSAQVLLEAISAHHNLGEVQGDQPVPERIPPDGVSIAPEVVNERMVEIDVTNLLDKFNSGKAKNKAKNKSNAPPVKQQAVLLVPADRQASTYLQRAFTSSSSNNSNDGVDGVDHINISSVACTDLGKFLDINANTPFEHRELAHFTSVGGLWYYVKGEEPDERFRYTWGDRCRAIGKKVKTRDVAGFKTIIADATWIKITASVRAVAELIESTLPFKNYYYYGPLNLKKTTPEAVWYTSAIEEIRRTLKARDATGDQTLLPDFSFLENDNGRYR